MIRWGCEHIITLRDGSVIRYKDRAELLKSIMDGELDDKIREIKDIFSPGVKEGEEVLPQAEVERKFQDIPERPTGVRIYRHGETESNVKAVPSDANTPLTEKGVEQAQLLGEQLKSQGVETIYHSPYLRAEQTARIAASISGGNVVPLEDAQERMRGETDKQFMARMARLYDRIRELPEKSVVIAHGYVINALKALEEAGGDVQKAKELLKKTKGVIDNTEYIEIGRKGVEIKEGETKTEEEKTPEEEPPYGEIIQYQDGDKKVLGEVISADAPGKIGVLDEDGDTKYVDLSNIIQATDKVIRWLQSKKIDTKGKLYDATLGLPITIYNQLISIIQASLKAGETVMQAAEKAINFLHDKWDKEFDKEGFVSSIKRMASRLGQQVDEDKLRNMLNDNPLYDGKTEKVGDELVNELVKELQSREKVTIKKIKDDIAETFNKIFHTFNVNYGKDGKYISYIINKHLSQLEMHMLRYRRMMDEYRNHFNKLPSRERIKFILYTEKGIEIEDPKLRAIQSVLRNELDKAYDDIKQINDIDYLVNYFPHFWRNDKAYKGYIASMIGGMSLDKATQFLKQRVFSNIAEGIKAGFTPVTDNPVDLFLSYRRAASVYRMMYDFVDELIQKGYAIPVRMEKVGKGERPVNALTGEKIPENFIPFNVRTFKQFTDNYYVKKLGSKADAIYVNPKVNDLLNTIFGKGLGEFRSLLRAFGDFGNVLNFLQLGVSLFHLTTTTFAFVGSNLGAAVSNLLAFRFKDAAEYMGRMAILPVDLYNAYKKRNELMRAVDEGMWDHPELKLIMMAGGRLTSDKIWTIHIKDNLYKSYYQLVNGEVPVLWGVPRVAFNALTATFSATTQFIMDKYVPMIKTYMFLNIAKNERELLKPKTYEEWVDIVNKAWNHIDNRFGEMVYDRKFWNKAVKETGFLGLRALGWTVGNLEQFGTGVTTGVGRSAKRLVKGQGLDPATSYTLGVIMTNAIVCAISNYLINGDIKNEKDLIGIRTGKKNKDGTDEYLIPVAHLREMMAYTHDVPELVMEGHGALALRQLIRNTMETLGNKINPAITFLEQVFHNRDYFNNPIIYHPNVFMSDNQKKSYLQRIFNDSQFGDMFNYMLGEFTPISFRDPDGHRSFILTPDYWQRQMEPENIAIKMGIVRAPMHFDRRTYQNIIMDEYFSSIKRKDFISNPQRMSLINDIQKAIANEDIGNREENIAIINSMIEEGKKQGLLRPNESYYAFKSRNKEYFASKFANLAPEQMLRIISWDIVPDSELYKYLNGYNFDYRTTARRAIFRWAKKNSELVESSSEYMKALEKVKQLSYVHADELRAEFGNVNR